MCKSSESALNFCNPVTIVASKHDRSTISNVIVALSVDLFHIRIRIPGSYRAPKTVEIFKKGRLDRNSGCVLLRSAISYSDAAQAGTGRSGCIEGCEQPLDAKYPVFGCSCVRSCSYRPGLIAGSGVR